jgi:hypothetical protein
MNTENLKHPKTARVSEVDIHFLSKDVVSALFVKFCG